MSEVFLITRRDLLKAGVLVGGGLALGLGMPLRNLGSAAATPGVPFDPPAFIYIGTDGVVTLIINKSEMGQGVYTSLPMLIAEELECDWKTIQVKAASVAPVYNHTVFGMQLTGGSTSVSSEWERMRQAGAAAREMLIAAAADTWNVKKESCRASNGAVYHTSGKSLTYGQLSQKAATMPVPTEVLLKQPSAFKIIGKPTLRLDTPEKVNGKAVFGIDASVAGMLIALVARPPVFGGKVKSFNDEKAKAVPGVKAVVQIDSGVAVIADSFWSAKKARDVLQVTWDEGPLATLSTEAMRKEYAGLVKTPGAIARKDGDLEKAAASGTKELSAEYEVPYLAHATMEPLNCTVDLQPGSCEIWVGTQMQTGDLNAAAQVAGLKPEQVKLHTLFLGGGFGRRANPHSDFVVQAVQVAKAVMKPVKVIWTREDDMKGGYYRPMWYDRISARLDASGNLVTWHHTIAGQSILAGTPFEGGMIKNGVDETSVEGAQDIPYEIPNLLVDLHSPKIAVPVQWWRSVGHSHTAFVVESFMDEVARAAGKDPYEFRRALLTRHQRHRDVLELAAEKAKWGSSLPAGRGRGIALHQSFGSSVAEVAEVSVNPGGEVRVDRVVCAVDCGRAVNPSTIKAQMESGIVFGLSAALHGAITLKDGRVQQGNFDDYPVVRMHEMPSIEVHILPSTEAPSGIGEPGTPPIAPAVTNAIFAATGKRIRRLPVGVVDMKKS